MSQHQQDFLETADRIGARLCRDAIWAGRACNWLGWSRELVEGRVAPLYRTLGPDLYGGTSGIGLFLASLFRFTGDPLQREAAHGALDHAAARLPTLPEHHRCGFFTGASGVAFALIEAGRQLENAEFIDAGLREFDRLAGLPPNSGAVGALDGSAGAIPALLDTAARFHRPQFVEAAIRHGENMLNCADKSDEGWSWKSLQRPLPKNLTGYSHGTAGIATALAELYAVTQDSRFRDAALAGLQYERTHFCAHQGNWPDFRKIAYFPSMDEPICLTAWCHGAPGIGLSRLRVRELLPDDQQADGEIEVALTTTQHWLETAPCSADGNYSLCHGAGGNAELLLVASEQLARPELAATAETVGRQGLQRFERNNSPWPCGVAEAGETPNLMLGLAGIGYFYLRLFAPREVPCLLLLRPAPLQREADREGDQNHGDQP